MRAIAKVGDTIIFSRNEITYEGNVIVVYENSVIVILNDHDAESLQLPDNKTVVSHTKYKIL